MNQRNGPVNLRLFDNNRAVLERTHPGVVRGVLDAEVPGHFSLCMSKTGVPVPRVGSTTMHSTYDPVIEAARWVQRMLDRVPPGDERVIVVFGFAFAYHLVELVRQGFRVVVVEPRPAMVRFALAHVDLREVLSSIELVVGDVWEDSRPFVVWPHTPTVKCCPQEYARFSGATAPRSCPGAQAIVAHEVKQSLRVLVVSPIYGGSLPIARFAASALSQIGHTARLFDASMFAAPFEQVLGLRIEPENMQVLQRLFQHLISEMIVGVCADFRPDLVLALAQAPLSIEALQRIRKSGAACACWFVEDFRYMQYWKQYAPAYDCFFTIQQEPFFSELEQVGQHNHRYLPLAADPAVHMPRDMNAAQRAAFGSDISFMGAGYYNRQCLFQGLTDFDFRIWGNQWDPRLPLYAHVQRGGARLSTEDTVNVFNATTVNINLHSSACHPGINPGGDFVNPRTFEIAACGAFQLVDRRSLLPHLFDCDTELIVYEDLADLREKIGYYLKNPRLRKEIAARARQRVMAEHTYTRRMQHLIAFVLERVPDCARPKLQPIPRLENIASFRKLHPETAPVLDAVASISTTPDINQITAVIQQRQHPIGYPEALFMLLNEYQHLYAEHMRP